MNRASMMGERLQMFRMETTFPLPSSTVFEAWTNEAAVKQWWGPRGFTNVLCSLQPQEGGLILIHMRSPDGMRFPVAGMYHTVDHPRRLSFSLQAFDDGSGHQLETMNTVSFEESGSGTKMNLQSTITMASFTAMEALADMQESWRQSLGRLEEFLNTKSNNH